MNQHQFQAMETALQKIQATASMISDMAGPTDGKTNNVAAIDVQQFCWMIADVAYHALNVDGGES